MDQATLEGCWEKTRRADELSSLLNQEWRAATAPVSKTFSVGIDEDGQPGSYRMWIEVKKLPPLKLSVIAGEIAHNLRSALDHLVFRQAIEHIGDVLAEKNARNIAFPICKTPKLFSEVQTLQFVSEDTRTLIEKYQPFKQRNSNLLMLHWFNRFDKHQILHPAAILAATHNFSRLLKWNSAAHLLEEEPLIKGGDRLEDRTYVVRLRFAVPGPNPQVQVDGQPSLLIGFGETPEAPLKGIFLPRAIQETQSVIGAFRTLLP